jgi:hypothetical protein
MLDHEKTLDIIFGRWKSQILYTGVKLGIFDRVTSDPMKTSDIARHLNLDFVSLIIYSYYLKLESINIMVFRADVLSRQNP